MHQIRFSLLGDPTSLPKPLAAFKGPTSNGRGREREGQEKGEGGTEGRREPRIQPLPSVIVFSICLMS